MIVFEDCRSFRRQGRRCAAAVGKFDGVHRGHRRILGQLKDKAAELGLPAVAGVIEPHPEEFFAAADADCPARLSNEEEKLHLLEAAGVDCVWVQRFDRAMSERAAQDYVRDMLVDGLAIAALVAGEDFRFGRDRSGDFALLAAMGAELGFEVVTAATCELDGRRVSSTRIRERLARGDLVQAERLLGRPYSMRGRVERGRGLGAEIGCPTCNIDPGRRRIPLRGVYACQVSIEGGPPLSAAASIGHRPTVTENGAALLEAHILDFEGDLYGRSIEVVFREKLREEVKFDDVEAMRRQIELDMRGAREALERRGEKTAGARDGP